MVNTNNKKKTKNYLSPQIIECIKDHDMALEIQVLTCDGHKNVVGFNWLRGSLPL